jgi:hypothetical protein
MLLLIVFPLFLVSGLHAPTLHGLVAPSLSHDTSWKIGDNTASGGVVHRLRGGSSRNQTTYRHINRHIIQTPLISSAAFFLYLWGSRFLDAFLVQALGVERSKSAFAFGPFVTLLGLVYSVILAQIYAYYFDRQGNIQTAIFDEVASLRALHACVEVATTSVARRAPPSHSREHLLGILHAHTSNILHYGFDGGMRHGRSPKPLVMLLPALEASRAAGASVLQLARESVTRVHQARARRFAATTAQLPTVQIVTQRLIASVLLVGFVLVDLGAPKLEALLFGVLSATFFLISSFLTDLADPFGGSWSVESARDECCSLLNTLVAAGCGTHETHQRRDDER